MTPTLLEISVMRHYRQIAYLLVGRCLPAWFAGTDWPGEQKAPLVSQHRLYRIGPGLLVTQRSTTWNALGGTIDVPIFVKQRFRAR